MGAVDTALSEHVYCVATTFKMTERVELEHSSEETMRVIQKAAAMGNW